jgi:hypothetical protein
MTGLWDPPDRGTEQIMAETVAQQPLGSRHPATVGDVMQPPRRRDQNDHAAAAAYR